MMKTPILKEGRTRMRRLSIVIGFAALAVAAWLPGSTAQDQNTPVQPARVVPMQNLETEAAKSGRPAMVPRAWGRLVGLQPLSGQRVALFFENDAGEIYVVRLAERGAYLYLDTSDQGGVVTVLRR
jgi:hypothetical protein